MAYLNETDLNTWTTKITCHLYGEAYKGSSTVETDNTVLKANSDSANIQIFELTSRINFLKEDITNNIKSLFVTTPTANKLLKLNGQSEFTANINNTLVTSDEVKTKLLKISDEAAFSEIAKLKILTELNSKKYQFLKPDNNYHNIFENNKLADDTYFLQANVNSSTTSKLQKAIDIKDSDTTSNIAISIPSKIDLSSDITITANLKNYNTTYPTETTATDFTDVYHSFKISSDGRIQTAWKNIDPTKVTQTENYRFVTDSQTDVWDKKVDNTYIPKEIYSYNDTYINDDLSSTFGYNVGRDFTPPHPLKKDALWTVEFGFKNYKKNSYFDTGLKFDNTYVSPGVYKKEVYANFLGSYKKLYGEHNYNPNLYALLDSPALTGVPTAPTANIKLNNTSTQIANLSYVYNAIQASDADKWIKFQEKIDFLLNNKHHMFNPDDCIIHHDIFTAYGLGFITKGLIAPGFDDTSYKTNPWHRLKIIKFGSGESHNFKIRVPLEYDTIWLRVLNDRWNIYGIPHLQYSYNTTYDVSDPTISPVLARYTGGHRNLNEISPDGGVGDSTAYYHKWVQIPININHPLNQTIITLNNVQYREITIYSGKYNFEERNIVPGDNWISGLAFSNNPYNLTKLSAVGVHWGVNNSPTINWAHDEWHRDNLAYFGTLNIFEFIIPIINWIGDTEDRLIYIIEHNDDWQNTDHLALYCNDIKIERFRTTYTNPFATHYNSKLYSRYLAARIPNSIIQSSNGFLKFKIDRTKAEDNFYFREIGVHSYIP